MTTKIVVCTVGISALLAMYPITAHETSDYEFKVFGIPPIIEYVPLIIKYPDILVKKNPKSG